MPIGPEPLGFVYYVAVKLAGYSFAGHLLRKKLGHSLHYIVFGIARTLLGVAAGIAYTFALKNTEVTSPTFIFCLFPVRFAEWFFLIWLFYRRRGITMKQLILYSFLGTILSYILDVPAIASVFILPGGVWVC